MVELLVVQALVEIDKAIFLALLHYPLELVYYQRLNTIKYLCF